MGEVRVHTSLMNFAIDFTSPLWLLYTSCHLTICVLDMRCVHNWFTQLVCAHVICQWECPEGLYLPFYETFNETNLSIIRYQKATDVRLTERASNVTLKSYFSDIKSTRQLVTLIFQMHRRRCPSTTLFYISTVK